MPTVAPALSALGLAAQEVGGAGAPAKQSPDEVNCEWCEENGAALVTHDRGKTDKEIVKQLAAHGVNAIFVHKDLRSAPAHCLVKALLIAESEIEKHAARGKLYHRLKLSGRLEKRER